MITNKKTKLINISLVLLISFKHYNNLFEFTNLLIIFLPSWGKKLFLPSSVYSNSSWGK